MAKSISRKHSADAANVFVRVLLCEISEALGGFSNDDLNKTKKFFQNKCAYTGKKLTENTFTIDHLIGHNKEDCGLHLYGNIVPATSDANKSKGRKDYKAFINSLEITDEEKIARIKQLEKFQQISGYFRKIDKLKEFDLFKDIELNEENKNPISVYLQNKYASIQDDINVMRKSLEKDEKAQDVKNIISEVDVEQSEIAKVMSRVPRWISKSDIQINGKILTTFLDLKKNSVFVDELKKLCAVDNFELNFKQMSEYGSNNHGKVFEVQGDEVMLWEPIKDYIHEKYANN